MITYLICLCVRPVMWHYVHKGLTKYSINCSKSFRLKLFTTDTQIHAKVGYISHGQESHNTVNTINMAWKRRGVYDYSECSSSWATHQNNLLKMVFYVRVWYTCITKSCRHFTQRNLKYTLYIIAWTFCRTNVPINPFRTQNHIAMVQPSVMYV